LLFFLFLNESIAVYSTSKENKNTLDNGYILKILNKDLTIFTFRSFIETANRSFLGVGCFNYYTLDKCTKNLAKNKNIDLLNLLLKSNSESDINWDCMAHGAAKGGHLDILMCIFLNEDPKGLFTHKVKTSRKNINFWGWILSGAGSGGNLDVVKFLKPYYVSKNCKFLDQKLFAWNHVAKNAASKGHTHIVEYLLSIKDHNINWLFIAKGNASMSKRYS